jgi:hypothetical protein
MSRMTRIRAQVGSLPSVHGPVGTPVAPVRRRPMPPAVYTAPLGRPIGPRRAIWGGWVAADDTALVVHRDGRDDLRIPHTHIRQIWLEGKNLALLIRGGESHYLPLTTLRPSWDRRFVAAVATAARQRPSNSR